MSLIGRIWRGEVGLARTFWVFGFAVFSLMMIASIMMLTTIMLGDNAGIIFLAILGFSLLYKVFILVAIWRSASRYQGAVVWTYLAKAFVVLSIMQSLLSFGRLA